MTCCDHGYGRPSWRPRVSDPATYRSGTPRNQHPAVARWPNHLRGLATAIHEISGLTTEEVTRCFVANASRSLLACSCYSTFAVAATIKIGEINPLTGRLAKQGSEIHQGVAVAVAEVNDRG